MPDRRQSLAAVGVAVVVAMVLVMGVVGDVAPLAPPAAATGSSAAAGETVGVPVRVASLREAASAPEIAPLAESADLVCEVVRSDATPFPGARVRVELGSRTETRFLNADAAGVVVLAVGGTQPTRVTFAAGSPEYSATPVTVFTHPGGPTPKVRLRVLALDAWVRGVVTDLGDRPLPDARVSWRRDDKATACDAAGRFAVRVPSGREDFRCLVLAPGYRLHRENVVLSPGLDVLLHIRLQPGPRIRGRVVDPDGRPVAGAAVETIAQRLAGERATTDGDGCYEIDCTLAEARKDQVAVRCPGFVPTSVWANTRGDAPVDFTLQVAGVVRGRVSCPDGRPAAGAVVRAGGGGVFGDGLETCTADECGAFVLDEQAPGTQQLQVSCAGFPPATATATVVRGAAVDVAIVLCTGHTARGVVVDDEARPVGGAWVMHAAGNACTDAQGRFELLGLPAVNGVVDVMEREHLPLRSAALTAAGDNRFVLPRAGTLRGLVVDARTGAGLDDFTIAVVGGDAQQGSLGVDWVRGGRRFQRTAGHWATQGLMLASGSSWRVRVTAPGCAAVVRDLVAATGEVTVEPIAMTAGVTVRGTVVAAATRAVIAGAQVRLLDHAPEQRSLVPYEASGGTDDDGTFAFAAVAPGSIWLAIEALGTVPCTIGPFVVSGDRDVDLGELRIGDGAVVTGTLRDADGRALADVGLSASSLHADDRHPTRLDARTRADGTFELAGLQPGTWRLAATLPQEDGVVVIDQRVQVVAGSQRIDVQPAGRGAIRGEVRGSWPATETPCVVVHRVQQQADPAAGFSVSAVVCDGRFAIVGLAPGSYEVNAFVDGVSKPRFARVAEPVVVRDGVPTPPVVLDLGAR